MTDWISLSIAVFGVGGTLTAPLLTQRAALKDKKLDAQIRRDDRDLELADAQSKKDLAERREIYTELNSKAIQYLSALGDCVAHETGDRIDPEAYVQLEEARRDFAECHSWAQMIVPDQILSRILRANQLLDDTYRELVHTKPASTDIEDLAEHLDTHCYQAVGDLRTSMRRDLGITGEVGGLVEQSYLHH